MEEKEWLLQVMDEAQTQELLELNRHTRQYGLSLSSEETRLLTAEQRDTLRAERRVEFGGGILPKLVYAFCDSEYIRQDNYADTLGRLQEIFYAYKNEMLDEISDDELISFMREQFDGVCSGDLDYLEETCLAIFAQAIRAGYRGYMGTDGVGEYGQFDEVTRWDRALYEQALANLF